MITYSIAELLSLRFKNVNASTDFENSKNQYLEMIKLDLEHAKKISDEDVKNFTLKKKNNWRDKKKHHHKKVDFSRNDLRNDIFMILRNIESSNVLKCSKQLFNLQNTYSTDSLNFIIDIIFNKSCSEPPCLTETYDILFAELIKLNSQIEIMVTNNKKAFSKVIKVSKNDISSDILKLLNKVGKVNIKSTSEKILELKTKYGDDNSAYLVETIFKKSIDEPSLYQVYGLLFEELIRNETGFETILIKLCTVYSKNIRIVENTNEPFSDLYYELQTIRRTTKGIISLFAVLYEKDFISEKVINDVLEIMVCNIIKDKENIDVICFTFKLIGKKLQMESDNFKSLYSKLKVASVDSKNLNPKLRFQIMDTIDLHDRNWKPRVFKKSVELPDDVDDKRKTNNNNTRNGFIQKPIKIEKKIEPLVKSVNAWTTRNCNILKKN